MNRTARARAPRRLRPPVLHRPSVRGRARGDAGPLLLVALVVAAICLLAGAVPPLLRTSADAAVRSAVSDAGDDADLVVQTPWEPDYGPTGDRIRNPGLADDIDVFRTIAAQTLDPRLRAVLRPPIAVVNSPSLNLTDGSALRTFQLTYLAEGGDGAPPAVTWIAGGPPQPAADPNAEAPYGSPPWQVQVGLSEADAAALRLGPGDRIPLEDSHRLVKDVRISGVFRPVDAADPGWRLAPWLLQPLPAIGSLGTTRMGGLVSTDSLPDLRLAFDPDELDRTARFAPVPDRFSWASAQQLTDLVVSMKATSGATGDAVTETRWQTELDVVLRQVGTRVAATAAQASVLLAGVLAGAVLVLLLAAQLLARRRAPALATIRQRGAALSQLGTELLVESAAVTLVAAALGLGLARAFAPGVAWGWAVPVIVAAIAAGPVAGTVAAARSTRDRRTPANRSARRWRRRTAQLRRAALEVAALAAAVAALVALRQRGILTAVTADPWSGQDTGSALPASAPTFGVLAGAVLLVRLLPAATGLALRQALRSRRPLAVFGAARAAATATRVLPALVLTSCAALACFALTVRATAVQGLADGAWQTVGADVRLDIDSGATTDVPALARHLAAATGVRQVVTAQVTDRAPITADNRAVKPQLVVVPAADLRHLLADTPLTGAAALGQLEHTGAGDVPALVRSADGSLRPGMRLQLRRDNGTPIRLVAVGIAPAIGDAPDVVLVDSAALAAAGMPSIPNTIWASGTGAANAAMAASAPADVVVRGDVQHARRATPLTAGLLRLAGVSAATLAVLGILALALAVAAGAPGRWQTLARLRTLGLRRRDTRWVAAGELLPPVLCAAVTGPLLAALVAHLSLRPLALALLTGQLGEPDPVLPWWSYGLISAALLVAVAAAVPIESLARRRTRLAEVLRAGEG
jgi:putative ABC transport system permease protein